MTTPVLSGLAAVETLARKIVPVVPEGASVVTWSGVGRAAPVVPLELSYTRK